MATLESSLRPYRTSVFDNARWSRFEHRPGDIFVCTPPKCGTTWTQTIVVSLLWPDGRAHRRCIKTHTPADGIPVYDDAKYVFVARDGRDAFMSYCHHFEVFKAEVRDSLNERALADGVPPMPQWNGDVHGFFARWLGDGLLFHHVRTFWELRARPNLLFVHYNDLKRDLGGEMRRIAQFLGIEVTPAQWPGVVERCTFEAMKARGDEIGSFWNFEGGAQSFLFKGTNGRWKDVLTEAELGAYERKVRETLAADAAKWLAEGRIH